MRNTGEVMGNVIREIKKSYGITNLDISKKTGYSASSVSRWLHNGIIPSDAQISLSKNYPLDNEKVKKECEVEYVDLSEVATRMGMSKETVMVCLQQDKFPFGFSYLPRHGKRHSYVMFRKPFEEFLEQLK